MAETEIKTEAASTTPASPTEKKGMSTGAKIAIGCGVLAVIGAIVLVILLVVGGNVAKKGLEDFEKELEKETQEVGESTYEIGETVDVNGVVWTITDAEDLGSTLLAQSEYSDDCVSDSGKYIMVKAEVKNDSSKDITAYSLKLYDSEMREYKVSNNLYSCVEEEITFMETLNPGITKDLFYVYEVPASATDLKVQVTDTEFLNPSVEYVSLGL